MQIPKYVSRRRNRWVYRPYLGKDDNGKVIWGDRVSLCSTEATMAELWAAYESVTGDQAPPGTLRRLFDDFEASAQFDNLAMETQKQYHGCYGRICETKLADGRKLGEVLPERITIGRWRAYLDNRARTAPYAGNREISAARAAYRWGIEREKIRLQTNPLAGIKKEREQSRDRLVTPEEFWAVHDHPACPDPIKIAMRLAVGCRGREIEVLRLTWSAISDDYIHFDRRKGSKNQNIKIVPFMRAGLELAKRRQAKIAGRFVITKKDGQPYTADGFRTAWQRHMKRVLADENSTLHAGFRFHDLKACGVSHFTGDKLKASGHKSGRMLGVYDRERESVDGTEIPQRLKPA